MSAALDDAPVAQDNDLIGMLHGRYAMRNQNGRSLAENRVQAPQDALFGPRVHTGEGIVEN